MVLASGSVDGVEYTLSLALFDAVPVALAALAYTLASTRLIDEVARRRMALGGTVLVALGGTAKVVWKVVVAASGNDITWLDDLLFPLLAAGLPLLGGALSARTSVRATLGGVTGLQLTLLALVLWVSPDAARGLAIAVMTVSTLWIAAGLIRRARRRAAPVAARLVVFNVVVAFVLAGLAQAEQTILLQWIEEILNAGSQACLLAAVVLLARSDLPPGAPVRPAASPRGLVRR